ncbi:MAG: NAD(P)H-dependent oxidoreductase [Alistipes sp.]|nr:NAD(P)H-dependent oxidoreductase [Alistipes sp.]
MNAKIVFSAMFTLFTFASGACGSDPVSDGGGNSAPAPADRRALVVYFSCTNTTRDLAVRIAEAAGAALWRIEPEVPYSAADLNYNNDSSRANREQNDPSARPAIKGKCEHLADCDVIFLGYPIWWGLAPKAVHTFLESHDLAGKTVVPFCTSGSSGIGSSGSDLQRSAPRALWKQGRRFGGRESAAALRSWVESLELD